MGRPRSKPDKDCGTVSQAATILPALDIRPEGIYLPAQVRAALNLRASSLRSEWRAGRLRIIRRCGRNYLLGRDVLKWLDGGEVPAPKSTD